MADEITDTDLATAALQPAKVKTDAGEVEQRPISDLLAVQNRIAGNAVSSGWGAALRPSRMIPPGTTGPKNSETD